MLTNGDTTAVFAYPNPAPVPAPSRRVNLFPDLLAERIEKYKVIMPPFTVVYDRVLVYPLDDADQVDKVGSIVLPNSTKSKHGAQRGLLIRAGARAQEHLYSHGIELGHIIVTAHLAPWQREYSTPQGLARVLVLRTADIVGSEDLDQAFARGDLWMEMDASTGQVELAHRTRNDPPENDEGI